MPITRTPMIDDDGSGTTGTIINNAWKTEFYNQIDAYVPTVDWVDVPYSAANFAGTGGMTWTVDSADQATYGYSRVGRLATVLVTVRTTSIGGTPSVLMYILLPFSPQRAGDALWLGEIAGGAKFVVRAYVVPNEAAIYLNRLDGATWAASTNALTISGQFVIMT